MIDKIFSNIVSYVAHFGGNVSAILFFYWFAGVINVYPGHHIGFAIVVTIFFDALKEYLDYTRHKTNGVPLKQMAKMAIADFITDGIGIYYAVSFILWIL